MKTISGSAYLAAMRRAGLIVVASLFLMHAAYAGDTYVGKVLYRLTPPAGEDHINAGFPGIASYASQGMVVGGQYVWLSDGSVKNLHNDQVGEIINQPVNVYATDGFRQVGNAPFSQGYHALVWYSDGGDFLDLHPAGWTSSTAYGIDGEFQVGSASKSNGQGGSISHAMSWSNTGASAVDLNPSYAPNSRAYGTDGAQQVGVTYNASFTGSQATLWSGTAASAVNLHPASGYSTSVAYDVSGSQQVGVGFNSSSGYNHALLWSGTAGSVVDLNAPGFDSTGAFATNGAKQVGYGVGYEFNNAPHALVWSGSVASVIDLYYYLPDGSSWNQTYASTVDSSGKIWGLGSGTYNGVAGTYAVEWIPLLKGDFNRDDKLDASDIAAMQTALADLDAYRIANSDVTDDQLTEGIEDVNGDGLVNNADLQQLLIIIKNGGGSSDSVPEPGTAVLATLGAIGIVLSRRIRTRSPAARG